MNDEQPVRLLQGGEVCAVVVTYHPDDGFGQRLRRVVPQVDATFIVDNGSRASSLEMLRRGSQQDCVHLVENDANLGIARALNIGIQRALAHGYSSVLLLDQDTEVDDGITAALCAARAACPYPERVALVGARFRDPRGRGDESRSLGGGGPLWEEVESVITSGTLLCLDAYASVGPFRDEFFIDHVDSEYCFRARRAGYRVIQTRAALMSHTVGAPTRHRLWRKARWTTNHSADRRYYIARNNTVLLREYGTPRGGSWRLKSLIRCFRLCKRIAFYERDKSQKILAVWEGWWDALRGNMGPRRRRDSL